MVSKERIAEITIGVIGYVVVVPVLFLVVMWFVASAFETIGEYNAQHDRCLKHATNGYEIRECR